MHTDDESIASWSPRHDEVVRRRSFVGELRRIQTRLESIVGLALVVVIAGSCAGCGTTKQDPGMVLLRAWGCKSVKTAGGESYCTDVVGTSIETLREWYGGSGAPGFPPSASGYIALTCRDYQLYPTTRAAHVVIKPDGAWVLMTSDATLAQQAVKAGGADIADESVRNSICSSTSTSNTSPSASTNSASDSRTFSFLDHVGVDDFEFSIQGSVTMGSATTTTVGENPDEVTVVAPVTGSGTVTNLTAGYIATRGPFTNALALYPAKSALCSTRRGIYNDGSDSYSNGVATGDFFSAHGVFCGVEVATFAPQPCDSPNPPLALQTGEPSDLAVLPNGSSGCEQGTDPGYLQITGVPTSLAQQMVSALDSPPLYWVLATDGGFDHPTGCPSAARSAAPYAGQDLGDTSGTVIASRPAGLKGCSNLTAEP